MSRRTTTQFIPLNFNLMQIWPHLRLLFCCRFDFYEENVCLKSRSDQKRGGDRKKIPKGFICHLWAKLWETCIWGCVLTLSVFMPLRWPGENLRFKVSRRGVSLARGPEQVRSRPQNIHCQQTSTDVWKRCRLQMTADDVVIAVMKSLLTSSSVLRVSDATMRVRDLRGFCLYQLWFVLSLWELSGLPINVVETGPLESDEMQWGGKIG